MENKQNVYYKVEVDAVVRGWGIESRSDEKTTPQQSGSRFKNEFGFRKMRIDRLCLNGVGANSRNAIASHVSWVIMI